jgi:hypothetical protein
MNRLRFLTTTLSTLALFALAHPALAVSYVSSGTATYCHAGNGSTNTWNSLTVGANIPAGTAVSFVVASASSCSDTPAYGSTTYSAQGGSTTPITISSPASKALFIQVLLTGNGTSTPTLSSLVLVDTPASDTAPPSSSITPPSTGTLSGTVTFSATATDSDSGVSKVNFYYTVGTCSSGGTLIGSAVTPVGNTYSTTWKTVGVVNGTYHVCSIATDTTGNVQTTPSTVTVSTSNNPTKPTVFVTSPGSGATVNKTSSVTVKGRTVSFGGGISKVSFKYGSNLIAADTTGVNDPNGGKDWSVSWNTTTVPSGRHNLTATATTASGKTVSANVAVDVP